jgi:hypothetical protein
MIFRSSAVAQQSPRSNEDPDPLPLRRGFPIGPATCFGDVRVRKDAPAVDDALGPGHRAAGATGANRTGAETNELPPGHRFPLDPALGLVSDQDQDMELPRRRERALRTRRSRPKILWRRPSLDSPSSASRSRSSSSSSSRPTSPRPSTPSSAALSSTPASCGSLRRQIAARKPSAPASWRLPSAGRPTSSPRAAPAPTCPSSCSGRVPSCSSSGRSPRSTSLPCPSMPPCCPSPCRPPTSGSWTRSVSVTFGRSPSLKLFRVAGRAAKRHLGHRARHQAQFLPLRQPRPGVSWP